MKFFIPAFPGIEDETKSAQHYQAIVTFAEQTLQWKVGPRRIQRIDFHAHSGREEWAEVGEPFRFGDTSEELVYAILESTTYLICTWNRGVKRGMPYLVGKEEVWRVQEFDAS